MNHCFVKGCTSGEKTLFAPSQFNLVIIQEWIKALPPRERPFDPRSDEVCRVHFNSKMLEEKDIYVLGVGGMKTVKKWSMLSGAVPSIFPEDDTHPQGERTIQEDIQEKDMEDEMGILATEDTPCDNSPNEDNSVEVNSGSDTEDSESEEEFLKAEYLKVFSCHENQEKEDKSELEFESAASANTSTLNNQMNQANYNPRNQLQDDFEILPSSSSELPRPLTIKIERISEEDIVQGSISLQEDHIDIGDTLNKLIASNSNGNGKSSNSGRQQFIATKSFPSVSIQRAAAAVSKKAQAKGTGKIPGPDQQQQGNSESLEGVIKKKRGRPKGSRGKKNWLNRKPKIAPSVLLQKQQPKLKFSSLSTGKNVSKGKGSKCSTPPPPTLQKQPPIVNSSDEDISSYAKRKTVSVQEIPLALQKWLDKNNKSNNTNTKDEDLHSEGSDLDDGTTDLGVPHQLKISPKKSKMGRPKMQRRQKRKVLKVKTKTSTHLNPLGKVDEKVGQTRDFEKNEEMSNKKLKSDKRPLTDIIKLSPKEGKTHSRPEPVETPAKPPVPAPAPVPSRQDEGPNQKLKDILTKMSTTLVQKGKFKKPVTSSSSSLASEVESKSRMQTNGNGLDLGSANGDSQSSKSIQKCASPQEKAHTFPIPTDFAAPVKRPPGRPRKLKVSKHTARLIKTKRKKVLASSSLRVENPKSDSEPDRESEPEPEPAPVVPKPKHKLIPSSRSQKYLSQKSITIARKAKKSSYRRKRSHLTHTKLYRKTIAIAKRAEKINSSTPLSTPSSGSKIKTKKDTKKDEHTPILNTGNVSGNARQTDKTKTSSKEEMLRQYPDVQVGVNNLSMEEIEELKASLKNKVEGKAKREKATISKAKGKSTAESESVPGPSKAALKKRTKEYCSWEAGITERNVSIVVSDCETGADNSKDDLDLDAKSSSVAAVKQPKQTAKRSIKFNIGKWNKARSESKKSRKAGAPLLEKAAVPDSPTKAETVTVNASAKVLGQRDKDLSSSEDEMDSNSIARAKSPSPSPSKAKLKRGRPRKIIGANVPSSGDINDDKLETGRNSCESEIIRASNSKSASSSLSRKSITPVEGDGENGTGSRSKQKSKSPGPAEVESVSSEMPESTTPLTLANDNSVSEPLFSSPSPPSGNTSKPRCFVLTCTHQSTKLFHSPLEDSSLFKEWLKYIPKRERPFTSNDKICSDHFPPEMLKTTQVNPRGKRINLQMWRWKLNLEAVPVLFRTPVLALSPLVINDNNEVFVGSVEKPGKKAPATAASASTRRTSKLKDSTLEEVTCVVPGCEGTKDKNAKNRKLTFHKFPFATEYRDLWVREISRKTGVIIPATVEFLDEIRICGLHFTATDYEGNVRSSPLRMRAVPSLFSLVKKSSNLNNSKPGHESDSYEALVSPLKADILNAAKINTVSESDTILSLSLSAAERMSPESVLNSSTTSGNSRRKQNLSKTRSLSPSAETDADTNAAPVLRTPEKSSVTNTSNTGTRGGRGKMGSKSNKRSAGGKANSTASIASKIPKTSNDTPRIPNPSPITFHENDDDFADDGHDPLDTHDQSESETNPGTRSRSHSPELLPAAGIRLAVTSKNTPTAHTGKTLMMDQSRPTITINQNIFESSHVDQPDLQNQNENAVQQDLLFTSPNVFQNSAPVSSQSHQLQHQQQVSNLGVGSGAGPGPGQEPTRTVMVPRYINLNGSGRMLVYEPLQIPMTLPLTPVPDGEVGVPSMINPMSPAPSFQNYLQGHGHGVPLASPEQQQPPFMHDASSSPLGAVPVVAAAVNSVPQTPIPVPVPVPVSVPASISRSEEIIAESARKLPHVTITKLTPARNRQAISKSKAGSVASSASAPPPLVPLQKPRTQKQAQKQGPGLTPTATAAAAESHGKKKADDVIPTNQTKLFRIDPNEGKYLISRKNGKTLVSPYDPKNLPAGVIKETVVTPNQGKIVFPSPQEGETILVVVPNNTISNMQSSPPVASGSKRKAPGSQHLSAGKKPLTGLSSSGSAADVISISSDEDEGESGSTQPKTTNRSTGAATGTPTKVVSANEKKTTKPKAGPPLFLIEGDKLNLEKMYRWKEILKLPAGGSWSMQLLKESSQKNSHKYICIAETAVLGGSMVFQRVLKIKEDLNFEIFVKGSDCTSVLNENNEKIKSIRDLQDLVTNLSAFVVCNGLKGYGNVAAGSISTGKKVGDMWFSLKCEHLCLASNVCAACAGLFKTVNASALMRVVNQSQVRPATTTGTGTPAPRALIGPRSRIIAIAQSQGQSPSPRAAVTRGVHPIIYHGVCVNPSAQNPGVQPLPRQQQPPQQQQRLTRPRLLLQHSQPASNNGTSHVPAPVPSPGNANIRFVHIAPRMPVLTYSTAQVAPQGTVPTQNESAFSDLLILTGEPGESGGANNTANSNPNHQGQQLTIQTDPEPTASTSSSNSTVPVSVAPQPIQNMSLTSTNNFSPVLPSSFSFSYLDPTNL